MISIILPTYNEAENIKIIIPNISEVLSEQEIRGEIIVVDDGSPDGTAEIAEGLGNCTPVKVHVRKDQKGLATAVMKGFELAEGDIWVVMDADLSHPVTKIPEMIRPIMDCECEASVGTRYVAGGGSNDWPFFRKIVSKGAGLLARGLVDLSDPTSGFMAIRGDVINGVELDPIGWKIVLEVIVKTGCDLKEIPFVFDDRHEGESKLSFKVQIDYIRHLWKLYAFKYSEAFQFIKFCLVGVTGLVVDTFVLASLVELLSLDPRFAAIFAFFVAVSSNYILNRLWTFKTKKRPKLLYSYIAFVLVCFLGLGIRIGVMHLLIEYAAMGIGRWYILASLLGIFAATVFNFLGSKYIAFSQKVVRDQKFHGQ